MNIDDMPTGQDMNIAVARRVMEWSVLPFETHQGDHRWLDALENYPYVNVDDGRLILWREPNIDGVRWHPSHDIADVWEVLEKLRECHGAVQVGYQPVDSFYNGESDTPIEAHWYCWTEDDHFGKADTAPLAICRAALKAVQ